MIKYEDFLGVIGMAEDKGRYIVGLCPFHEDSSPSLLIYKDGWWRCLGCNKNGQWVSLWNRAKGNPVHITTERRTNWNSPVMPGESLEIVAANAHEAMIQFPSLQWYMEMRGVQDRIEPCELGYHNGWYTVPVYNIDHELKTVVFRAAPHIQEVTGLRYWCKHEPIMYVPDWRLYEDGSFLIVVFGIFDALAISDLRLPVATVTSGKDQFKADWLHLVRKPIYIIPDAGEYETGYRLANELGWRGHTVRLSYPERCKDPADFLKEGKREELVAQLSKLGDSHGTK